MSVYKRKRPHVPSIPNGSAVKARRWMLPVFVLSGFSSLVLEIVWVRLASLALGVTLHAVAVVVAAFMGGLAIGSYLFGRIADARHPHLAVYSVLEGGIAILGLGVTWSLQHLPRWVAGLGMNGNSLSAAQAGLVFLLVLPPCVLMGATLPILSRTLADPGGASRWVGWLYGFNTLGAVSGAFLTDFALIPSIGVRGSAVAAVVCSGFAAMSSLAIARSWAPVGTGVPIQQRQRHGPSPWPLYVAYGFSGFAALGLQVTWTRLFLMYMPGRAFVFSLILTTYLAGLAIGSTAAAGCANRSSRPATVMVGMQTLLAATALAGVLWINPVDRMLMIPAVTGPLMSVARLGGAETVGFRFDVLQGLGRAVALFAMPTLLMGAIFPFAGRVALDARGGTGRPVGELYAANTVGAIAGSIAVGFWVLPDWGAQVTLLSLAALIVVAAALTASYARPRATAAGLTALAAVACGLFALLPSDTLIRSLYLAQHALHFGVDHSQVRMLREGPYGTVTVVETPKGPGLLVDSVYMMGGNLEAQRYASLEGHLPALLHPDPREALVIGFGLGMSMGAVSLYPGVEKTRCVELNPTVLEAATWFRSINYDVLNRPRTEVVIGDGRNYLLRSHGKFDVMTFEPPPPVNAGVSNLYSQEFYGICRDHLTAKGVVAQWLPLTPLGDDGARAVIRTFQSVFPFATLWQGSPSNLVLVGSVNPLTIDADRLRGAFGNRELRKSLQDIGVEDVLSLLGTFLHGPDTLRDYAAQAPIVTDDRPWLEYRFSEARQVAPWLRQRSMAELQKHMINFPPYLLAALQQRMEAWQRLYDLNTYAPKVSDESVRALYYYALARRIHAELANNPYADALLSLDGDGMKKSEEAAMSVSPKSAGAFAMRLMLQSRYPEAEAVLRRAAAAAPLHPLPRLLLGVMASSQGRAEEADLLIRQGMSLLDTDDLRQMVAALLQESAVPIPGQK